MYGLYSACAIRRVGSEFGELIVVAIAGVGGSVRAASRCDCEMGLPKPLGPFEVSFAEFELRRTQATGGQGQPPNGSGSENGSENANSEAGKVASAEGAPIMRVFYPTASKSGKSVLDTKIRSWVPNVNYMWGFLSRAILPKSQLRRSFVWMLTCKSLGYSSLSFPSSRIFSFLLFSQGKPFRGTSNIQIGGMGGKHTAVKLPLQLELVMSIVNLSKWEIPFLLPLSSKCSCDIM